MDESVIKHLEQQQQITKLSQAIRLGCKMAPRQCKGSYVDRSGGACAIGAAMIGMGLDPVAVRSWYELRVAFGIKDKLHGEITHRNDFDGWSREGIANWLEKKGY